MVTTLLPERIKTFVVEVGVETANGEVAQETPSYTFQVDADPQGPDTTAP